jgi:hypothetical protein
MTPTKATSRPRGEDAIYFAEDKRLWVGAVTVGFEPDGRRIRRKVSVKLPKEAESKAKAEIRKKLRELRSEIEAGVFTPEKYTVEQCVRDWLRTGLKDAAPAPSPR